MASARVAQQLVMMKDVKVNTNELIMFGHLLRSAAEIAVTPPVLWAQGAGFGPP